MRLALVLLMAALAVAGARAQDVIYTPGNGVSLPSVLKQVKPAYTDAAREAGIQGIVEMSTVVKADGTVGDVKVTESLDAELGLDNQAIEAMKQWTFEPGKRDGKPVAVRVAVQMRFTLK